MKNFVVNFGRGLIDFSSWVVLILIIIFAIYSFFAMNPLFGIGVLVIGLVLFTILYYFLYLLIDIRDILKEINGEE